MLNLLWPVLTLNSRILGLIWRAATYFVQNNTTIIPPGQHSTNYNPVARRGWPISGAKLKALSHLSHKMFQILHFLKSDMVFGIIHPFSWLFNASREKSCATSMPFLLTYIWRHNSIVFPVCLIIIGQFKFRRTNRVQG